MKPIDEIPYTTRDGVIQPGDKVLVLTCSHGNPQLSRAIYVGMRKSNVVVKTFSKAQKLVHKDTGEDYNYKKEPRYPEYPNYRLYPYGSDVRVEAEYEYRKACNERGSIIDALQADYVSREYVKEHIRQLQRNRIFPANYAM